MDTRTQLDYDGLCPNCFAGVLMVNTSWAECVSSYCKFPYSCNGIWVTDDDA